MTVTRVDARLLILTADRVINGTGGIIPHGAVKISKGRITAVAPFRELAAAAETSEVLRFPGTSLLPGFVDTHVHTTLPGDQTRAHD